MASEKGRWWARVKSATKRKDTDDLRFAAEQLEDRGISTSKINGYIAAVVATMAAATGLYLVLGIPLSFSSSDSI